MTQRAFSLDEGGYFTRRGRPFVPLGVNYWPASCGVEMWQAWPADEIRRDLRLVRDLGLNTVRFFLRWQDFEPVPGRYRASAFRRLDQFLAWCESSGVLAHPSFFVGWMSGGIFWPRWIAGGDLFLDPALRRRAFAFAGEAARVCAKHRDSVLAVDQGNEICCLPDCLRASPAEIASWCSEVNRSIRRAFPDALIVSGNDQNQIVSDTGWRLGEQPGCDFHSIHGYPMSQWHSIRFDGMGDPLARSLLPFYVKVARAFGPVMVQEFGTLLTADAGACDGYLRSMLPACLDAGANGFLWWCLRDIRAREHPYDKNAFEGSMGLVGPDGRPKPALRYFREFAASCDSEGPARAPESDILLYWPRHYYARDNPFNPGNDPRPLSRRLALAHFALEAMGLRAGIVRGDRPLEAAARPVIATGAFLTAAEARELSSWVKAGGRLLLHGVGVHTWGKEMNELVGAAAADMGRPSAEGVRAFGARWSFRRFPSDIFPRVSLGGATVAASDRSGAPILLVNRLGRGTVVACLAQPEEEFADESDDRAARPRWHRWYRGVLGLLGPRR